jgi:hypothetical protein
MNKVNVIDMEKQLDKLIEKGIIKNVYEIKEMTIHDIPRITGICVKDILCYFCQKNSTDKNCNKCNG